jgi:hypothetical protein
LILTIRISEKIKERSINQIPEKKIAFFSLLQTAKQLISGLRAMEEFAFFF